MNQEKNKNELVLEWFGHSCFRINIKDLSFFLDPVRKNKMLGTTLDPFNEKNTKAIFISHDHWDHFNVETIMALLSPTTDVYCPYSVANSLAHRMTFEAQNQTELEALKESVIPIKNDEVFEIERISVKCLAASEGVSFLFNYGDKKLLFMGDSVATKEMIMEKPNVVLFPMWAVLGEEAKKKEFLELGTGCKCIPMHYHRDPDALPNFYISSEDYQDLLQMKIDMMLPEKDRTFRL
ncbi:MAG: MBL fold metallo-hydrolase [Thermoplasmata archaeon]|nr:MAG: MBL fold metallo-hydrolase [Thermoplasmata archaeon]